MKIEKNWAYEDGIPKSPMLPEMHIDLLVKDGMLWMGKYWLTLRRKKDCFKHKLSMVCITYISRFIIITKQLSDIIIKQVGVCFLLTFMLLCTQTPFVAAGKETQLAWTTLGASLIMTD